jgi:hypothetical protein
MNVRLQNNTFIKGSLGLTHSTNTYTWGVFDNLFETTSLTAGGSVALSNGTNAYKGISVLASSLGGDLVLTTVDFQSGPLGNFYYNTNSSATNTAYLINRSTNNTPALVGLYHYTTRPDQAKDGDSSGLDMGFHYITTTGSSSTTPYDADGDGIPDYLEDLDGSGGNANSGEPDWQDASDPGLTVRITEPRNGVP